jgi:tRNA (guanine37-N1)-methyltransferase
VDERVRTQLVTDEISIGDYVLSGGELAAMVIIDAVTRLIPGALGYELSAHQDSHAPGLDGLLEGPHYTRPHTFRGESAPEVLLSGHHANVERWRREQALLRTLARRPALLDRIDLSQQDQAFLRRHGWSPQERQ